MQKYCVYRVSFDFFCDWNSKSIVPPDQHPKQPKRHPIPDWWVWFQPTTPQGASHNNFPLLRPNFEPYLCKAKLIWMVLKMVTSTMQNLKSFWNSFVPQFKSFSCWKPCFCFAAAPWVGRRTAIWHYHLPRFPWSIFFKRIQGCDKSIRVPDKQFWVHGTNAATTCPSFGNGKIVKSCVQNNSESNMTVFLKNGYDIINMIKHIQNLIWNHVSGVVASKCLCQCRLPPWIHESKNCSLHRVLHEHHEKSWKHDRRYVTIWCERKGQEN